MRTTKLFFALTAASLSLTSPVMAREASRAVSYADLDLSKASDVQVLHQRIGRALEAVCGSYATVERYQYDQIDQCRADAKARAAVEVARIAEGARRLSVR
jgi:UrcA family protein